MSDAEKQVLSKATLFFLTFNFSTSGQIGRDDGERGLAGRAANKPREEAARGAGQGGRGGEEGARPAVPEQGAEEGAGELDHGGQDRRQEAHNPARCRRHG